MASKPTIHVDIDSNLDKEVIKAQQLKSTLEAAGKVRIPIAVGAARQGVDASGDSGKARSIGLGTGASSRDFAKQAQGLGGLVHIYATFAANLFAVGAAYSALSKAADTANMVKGLDQLGAASGRSLGNLAKQMAAVADGALSMKEAISSTALASAGGINNANILRMTEVAKKASLALGRDMTDSMDRLTKGIVKVQPELLDELGIMTRVIPAQEAYARQLGKTAGSLTDFEKRQAFANAVLAEGEKKFGSINIDANPYAKISASITDISQKGLTLVNTVLTPILNILSSNPTALTLAMGAVASVLLKQAAPALGFFKESMKESADLALKLANKRSIEAKATLKRELADVEAHVEKLADVKIAAADRAAAATRKAEAASGISPDKFMTKLLAKGAQDITGRDFSTLLTRANKAEQAGNSALADSYRKLTISLHDNALAEQTLAEVKEKGIKTLKDHQSVVSTAGRTQALADRANLAAASKAITSTAAQTGAINGFRAAITEASAVVKKARSGPSTELVDIASIDALGNKVITTEKIVTPAMGRFRGNWTLLSAGISGATGALSTFLGFMSPWIAAAGVLAAAIAGISSYLSKNTVESDKFTKSLETGTDAIRVAKDVYTEFTNLPVGEALSVKSLTARATAVTGLTDSIADQISKYKELLSTAGWFDNITEGFWSFFHKSAGYKLADSLTEEVSSALTLLDSESTKKEVVDTLAKVLNVSSNEGIQGVSKALTVLGASGAEGVPKLQEFAEALLKVKSTASETLSSLTEFTATSEILTKAAADFNNSLMPRSQQDTFAIGIINNSLALANTLKDPIKGITALNNLVTDSSKLALFTPEQSANLLKYTAQIKGLNSAQLGYQQSIPELQKQLEALKVKVPKTPTLYTDTYSNEPKDYSSEIKELTLLLDLQKRNKAENLREINNLIQKLNANNGLIVGAFGKGIDLLDRGLSAAAEKAAVTIGQANLAGLSGPGIAEESNRLRQLSIKAQTSLVDATYDNTIATIALNNSYERSKSLEARAKLPASDTEGISKLTSTVDQLEKAGGIINSVSSGMLSSAGLSKVLKDAVSRGELDLAKALQPLKQSTVGKDTQLSDLGAQSTASNIQGRKDILAEQLATTTKLNGIAEATNKLQDEKLQLQTQFSGLYDKEALTRQQNLERQAISVKQSSSLAAVEKELKDLATSGYDIGTKAYEQKQFEISSLKTQQITELNILKIKQAAIAAGKSYDQGTLELKQKHELLDISSQLSSAQIASEQSRLSSADSLNQVDKEFLATQTNLLALQQLDLSNSLELEKLEEDKRTALKGIADQRAADAQAGISNSQALLAEETRITSLYTQKLALQASINAISQSTLNTTMSTAVEQAKLNKLLEDENSLAASLETVFGNVGAAVGELVKSLTSAAISQDNLTKSKIEELRAAEAGGPPDPKAIAGIQDKYAKQSTKLELDNISSISRASKKLVSEKTAGYKILNTIEKAAAAYKAALQLKDLAMDIKSFGIKLGLITQEASASIASSTAITATKAAAAPVNVAKDTPGILSSFSSMGPVGFAIGAALVASLVAMAGGGGKSGPKVDMTGLTSADRQATQGTGLAWVYDQNAGTRVKKETGGGVFGDAEAKSTSIVNSLEIMKANSIEGLGYDNRMLKALETLADSVKGAAKSLYAIPGLRQGTNFGTQEGSRLVKAGFIDSIPVFGKLLLGLPVIGKTLSSIFGGKVTGNTSITSAGIQLKGSFADVAKDVSGSILQFKDILTNFHKSGGWFSSSKDWSVRSTETQALAANVSTAISDIFKDANSLFVEIGKKTKTSSQYINSVLKTIDVSMPIDIMGLTGDALVEELDAVIGTKLSDAAAKIFPGFEKFRNFGEDYLGTVIRVVDGSNKVGDALTSIGKTLQDRFMGFFRRVSKFDISEALIKGAGSLENFMEQIGFFRENFLSEAERLAPIQKSVTTELTRLGISTSITKEEYKKLVLSQDLAEASGRSLYQSLMDLAPGFELISSKTTTFKDSLLDLQIALLNAQGRNAEALAISRQKTLAGQTLEEQVIQKQINLAEDANSARSLTITLLTAEGKASAALFLTRQKELISLNSVDAALQERIYRLQDEAKISASESAIYTALGDTEASLAITRATELKTIEDILVPAKKYLYALQDENTLKGKLTTAYTAQSNAIKNTITSLSASIKTLQDYKQTLTAGTASILTPTEKYAQAKSEVSQLAALAQATIPTTGTAADIASATADRDAAVSKLSNATTTFLESSKEMFAMGSAQYIADFNSVLGMLEATTGKLTDQRTDAEKQLDTLDQSLNFLDVIAGNTDDISTLLSKYLDNRNTLLTSQELAAQAGSIAAGAQLPLPVIAPNTSITPSTLGLGYPSTASNDILGNKELIKEIKALRDEVASLRADQQEQTGHLITTNYDANDKAAKTTAIAIEASATAHDWRTRARPIVN